MKKVVMILSIAFLALLVTPVVCQAIDNDVGRIENPPMPAIDQVTVYQQNFAIIRGGIDIRAVDLRVEPVSIPAVFSEKVVVKELLTESVYDKPPGLCGTYYMLNNESLFYWPYGVESTLYFPPNDKGYSARFSNSNGGIGH